MKYQHRYEYQHCYKEYMRTKMEVINYLTCLVLLRKFWTTSLMKSLKRVNVRVRFVNMEV